MSKFWLNKECYGGYAYIRTDRSEDTHIYKIVNAIQSNCYCDVPVLCNSEPYVHTSVVPVLNVIHCGVDETKVVRVAVDDCENIVLPSSEVVRCKDCKYYIDHQCYMSNLKENGSYLGKIHWTGEDDYCSYAERKEKQ